MGRLKVLKAGRLVTIQDEGRFGFRQYGIPQSGAMDIQALHAANAMLGNSKNYPAIEIPLGGLTIEAVEKTTICLSGAIATSTINQRKIANYEVHELTEGAVLDISPVKEGMYIYLGMAGKIAGKVDFGSLSTYLLAGFGGPEIKKGGEIVSSFEKAQNNSQKEWKSDYLYDPIIYYVEGPESSDFAEKLDGNKYTIGGESNRTGIRIIGPPIIGNLKEITSSAVVPGTIQLLPSGQPIVLMKDCQTTGGYPRIGKVINEDLGTLSQKKPGSAIFFKKVSQSNKK